jgi:hypothetical protein
MVAIAAMKLSGNAVVVAAVISLGAVLVFLGAFFKSIETTFFLVLDLAGRQAVCIEGRTTTSVDSVEGHSIEAFERVNHYHYVVQNQYVSVTWEGHQALRNYSGSTCKVYLTPRSKLLLSIEPIQVRGPH